MIKGASLFIRLTPEKELNKLKREIKVLDEQISKIADAENFHFKEFKIPYLPYQKIETDQFLKELYQCRAEFDYKYFIVKGLNQKLYNKEYESPGFLTAIKRNKNILLFDINKNFTQEQIQRARVKSQLIKSKQKEEV